MRYLDSDGSSLGEGPRIFLEVYPPLTEIPVLAMVDTAAPWCIFASRIGEIIHRSFDPVSDEVWLSTRLGKFRGLLYRTPLVLLAHEGEALRTDATVFVSPDWPGNNFVGYQGLLQWLRFAVDPELNRFYFGELT
jgi:hypothetical protein